LHLFNCAGTFGDFNMNTKRILFLLTISFLFLSLVFLIGCLNSGQDDDDDDDANSNQGPDGGEGGSGSEKCNWAYAVGSGILVKKETTWNDTTPLIFSESWQISDINYPSCTEGFAVGSDSNNKSGLLLKDEDGNWSVLDTPIQSNDWELYSISMTSPHQGIAVGADWENGSGIILMFDNDSWTQMSPPFISNDWWLTDIKMTDQNQAVAVGINWELNKPVILEYLDGQWNSLPVPELGFAYGLYSLDMTDPENGIAVGVNLDNLQGIALVISNSIWNQAGLKYTATDWDLNNAAIIEDQAILVGRNFNDRTGLILMGQGNDFSTVTPPSVSEKWLLYSVLMSDAENAMACGLDMENEKGFIISYSNGAWVVELRTDFTLSRIRLF